MSEVLPSLKAAWTRLPQKSPGAGQLRVVALDAVRAGISACLSTDGLHGLVVSLTPAERALIPQELDAASGSTLAASLTYFTDSAGEEGRFLHVWCRDHTVDDAFDSFCVLLCQKLENQTVTKALSASTAEFRKLLAESESPDSNVIGVIGELIFLRQLLRKDPGAIRAWAGPQGGRHDFRRGRNAVEVKTSLRSDVQGLTVTISAFDQLDVPADGRLILQVYQLEQVDNGDHSIATLSEDIRSNLEGDDDSLFVDRKSVV